MPSILEGAPRASFDTIEFPFTSRGARLEFREHTHEFPKMAGGQPEKLGRRLWVFSFECPFHASNLHFPNLYPSALDALTERAARGYTAELVIPEMGILRAFITKLDRRRRGAILSGEDVTLEFKEDDLEAFRNATTPVGRAALDEAAANVRAKMLGFGADDRDLDTARIDPYREPLGRLLGLVDSVLAIRDQVELFGARVGAQLEGIAAACRELHELLKGPDLSPLRESLRSLWDATHQLQQDLLNKGPGSSLVTYVVPAVMSVGQIAQQLYGDASRGPELLSLNASIADPFQVDAGLSLVVYAT